MSHIKTKKHQQVSKTKQPPPRLARLIELANMVPPKAKLPEASKLILQTYRVLAKDSGEWEKLLRGFVSPIKFQTFPAPNKGLESFPYQLKLRRINTQSEVLAEVINFCIRGLPDIFRTHVWQQTGEAPDEETKTVEAITRYSEAQQLRDNLRKLIAISTDRLTPAERHLRLRDIKVSASIEIDREGFIRITRDEFAAAIEDVELERIKECPVCQRIFWAGRIDQPACSKKCGHTLRNRYYQERLKHQRKMKENQTAERSAGTSKTKSKPKKK